ncbi:MAG: type IV pili methyl-accepting chemotaxis transducer N-terminal domain-containing protein [Sheuella sp.]|nr:type IV pili methyl-accepting chemotaxis transducer N-terminal domain-containing protein [Sheuella sp.]
MAVKWRLPIGRNYKLGVRLVSVSLAGLIFGLSMVLGTLWLSWALEGAAAAVNDTGSLRMQSVRIGLNLSQPKIDISQLRMQMQALEQTLENLKRGDPQRPLRMPASTSVQEQFAKLTDTWQKKLVPILQTYERNPELRSYATKNYLAELSNFVTDADRLVWQIEAENAYDTSILRGSQLALIVLMLAGSVALIYLLYGWVIRPVQALQHGITQMTTGDFDTRVPVEGHDEFGELATGFNDMAAQLKALYSDLESRVEEKTRQLGLQNKELAILYEFSAYLSQSGELEQRCNGFLTRLIEHFGAKGGTVRILDSRQHNLHLTVHQGISEQFAKDELCLHAGDCLCGEAAQKGVMQLHDFRHMAKDFHYRCQEEGFNSIAIAQIKLGDGQHLGSYTLHFEKPREFTAEDRKLFEAVGQHLAVAIENQRLLTRTRQLAVAEERNLVAQGLHDSIAQGLNFLKLQIQMLQDSIKRDAKEEVQEVIGLIDLGVRESYEDVRELLTSFRIKLGEGDLSDSLEIAATRFKQQSGLPVTLAIRDNGALLPSEHQLQILFILQEALSNIRKHANARNVQISLNNSDDFILSIQDDGDGFNINAAKIQSESHIGLKIMRERAAQLGARLEVISKSGQGTTIRLILPHSARMAA